nr:hypothetical protein [Clavibacter michiganensis]
MSEGPIHQWRASHKSAPVSTPNSARVCFTTAGLRRKAYCGRIAKVTTEQRSKVTCADCAAALNADTPTTGATS